MTDIPIVRMGEVAAATARRGMHLPSQVMMDVALKSEVSRLSIPGRDSVLLVSSHEVVSELADKTRFEKWLHPPLLAARSFGGNGLITAETMDSSWAPARQIVDAGLSVPGVMSMFPTFVNVVNVRHQKWSWEQNEFDMVDELTSVAAETVSRSLFGGSVQDFQVGDKPIADLMHAALKAIGESATGLGLRDVRDVEEVRRATEGIDAWAARVMGSYEVRGDSILREFMASAEMPDRTLSLGDVRNQIVTLMFAGHDTTAGLMSFVMRELLKDPALLSRAREEVDDALGGERPLVEAIGSLSLLSQIVSEALRLWPTAPSFGLRPTEKTHLTTSKGRYELVPDERLLVVTPAVHRDVGVWLEPEVFDPARFSPHRRSLVPNGAWVPFGVGIRSCPGRNMAIQETMVMVALTLYRFDLDLVACHDLDGLVETVTLKPERFVVRATPRRGREMGKGRAGEVRVKARKSERKSSACAGGELSIYVGTTNGTSSYLAGAVAALFKKEGVSVVLRDLDVFPEYAEQRHKAIIITSSFDGPPANARRFRDWMLGLGGGTSIGVEYAVFGCGVSEWSETYQEFPRWVDAMLSASGGIRIAEREEGDVRGDFLVRSHRWAQEVFDIMYGGASRKSGTRGEKSVSIPLHEVNFVENQTINSDLFVSGANQHAVLMSNRTLLAYDDGRGALIEIVLEVDTEEDLRAGATVSLLPLSRPESVEKALRLFSYTGEEKVRLSGPVVTNGESVVLTTREMFSRFVNVESLIDSVGLESLVQAGLVDWSMIESRIGNIESATIRPTVLDVLSLAPGRRLEVGSFLDIVGGPVARSYSISNNVRADAGRCEIVVARRCFSGIDLLGDVSIHSDLTPSYLQEVPTGGRLQLASATRRSRSLDECVSNRNGLVVICGGSAIGFIRGLLNERMVGADSVGAGGPRTALFFGSATRPTDEPFRGSFLSWQSKGRLIYRPCHSLGGHQRVKYVHEALWMERTLLSEMIERGAQVLIAGRRSGFGTEAIAVLKRILLECSSWPEGRICELFATGEDGRLVTEWFG